ncbi:hypothetical protein J2Z48_000347 [Croceifilum oryzae]|uniref:ParB-like N-terminal domain-containing protein n=1 Tax=Croceifilum oryzae TaxID=1553429 RepID=A0AAJ1TCV5_9BACL|nr:ParB N-terminal domain-containing protein [Croceifilum oryzae]MDQ0416189.1 hypothetical protein [Croceifilum oryzae]
MNSVISSLALVPAEQIYFHESHENERLEKICKSITEEGYLSNPPIAMKLSDDKYLLLDGAHRLMALKALDCKRIVVQLVEEKDVFLSAWNHLLPQDSWWEELQQCPYIQWATEPLDHKWLAHVVLPGGETYYLYSTNHSEDMLDQLTAWHHIVGLYQHRCHVRRIPNGSHIEPKHGEIFICYPQYTLAGLKRVVEFNRLMPAGITRCIVEGRLLNLRIPLEILQSNQLPVEQWQTLRNKWMNSLRFYTEPVYVCEA